MIERGVYSYWNPDGESNTSGFNSFRDFLVSITLSILTSKKHFKEISLVTNNFGYKVLFEKLKLPIDIISNELEKLNTINRLFWAYSKIYTYSIQNKPFIHIDNDVFLWDSISKEMKESRLCFQSLETPFEGGYGWYNGLLEVSSKAGYFPQIVKDNPVGYSLNCGLCGGNDINIFSEWRELSESYIFNPLNEQFFKDQSNHLIHQNLLHEQYFISSLTKSKGLLPEKDIKFMIDYRNLINDCYTPTRRYTHLWGLDKRNKDYIGRVYRRLEQEFPSYYERVMKYNVLTS